MTMSSASGGGAAAQPAKKTKLDPLVTGGTIGWDSERNPFFSMGEGTLRVPMTMHAENRARLCERLRRAGVGEGAVVVLQGGDEQSVYDTDTNWDYKQESNFQYLFGVKEPGCLGALRVKDARAVLLVPQLAPEYQAWCGPIKPPAWFHRAYAVDEVALVDEAKDALQKLAAQELLVLKGDANRDSGLRLPEPEVAGTCGVAVSAGGSQILWDEINECRLVKSEEEMKIMQYVNDVSSNAHIEVMRVSMRAGQREHLAEATFRYQSMLRGCFRTGYSCICPSGRRNAILHYGHPGEPNSESVAPGAMRLHDMGAEYHGYSADVTCSFPVGGRFDDAQRAVYGAVWAATLAVERKVKPGVCYKDMHRLAQRTLLEKMKEAGLFLGAVDEMMAAGLMSYFMPHGLGHSLGLDVHDVGGYEPSKFRKDDPFVKENLRLGRKLKEGMVITVEPGFYFVEYLIEKVLADATLAAFVDKQRLYELWGPVGGIRIEDDVVITATGCRVLTCVPREIPEIEAVMAGQEWTVSSGCFRSYTAA